MRKVLAIIEDEREERLINQLLKNHYSTLSYYIASGANVIRLLEIDSDPLRLLFLGEHG
jgi:hypothetical protein